MIAALCFCVLCYRSYAVSFSSFCWCARANLMKSNKAIMISILPFYQRSSRLQLRWSLRLKPRYRMVGDLCSTILSECIRGVGAQDIAARESIPTWRTLPFSFLSLANAVSCMHRWLTMSGILSADIRTLHLEKNLLFLGVDERNATLPSKSQSLNVAFYHNARRVQMFRDCLCESCVPMLTVQAHSASATT